MNAPHHEAPDRRRPARHGIRQAITRLRLAEARAVDIDLHLAVDITDALDLLVESLRRGVADLPDHTARIACPCCAQTLTVTRAADIVVLERARS